MADFITGNRFLSQAEMETNARYIYNYLGARGWSVNAIAGMLGNMQTESSINPGIWQNLREFGDPAGHGYGLVQWTPYTKYTDWCDEMELGMDRMDTALRRIEYELEHGIQYYKTPKYPETFAQFKTSTKSPYYLAMAFLANYERPANPNQPARGTQAEAWYEFLTGEPAPVDPAEPVTPAGKKKSHKMSLLLMYMATRRKV